jgi:hypothetical protein
VQGIDVDQHADRKSLVVDDDEVALVRAGHRFKCGAKGHILENGRSRTHNSGSRFQRHRLPAQTRVAGARGRVVLNLADQLGFVHDSLRAAGGVDDDDHPDRPFHEERHDVSHENTLVDRNDPMAHSHPGRCESDFFGVKSWRTTDARLALVLALVDRHARGTFATNVEGDRTTTVIAKDPSVTAPRAVRAHHLRQENGMSPRRSSLGWHAGKKMHATSQPTKGPRGAWF